MLIIGFLFLLFFLLFVFSTKSIEGMTKISTYTFLGPVDSSKKWDKETITQFVSKFNSNFSNVSVEFLLKEEKVLEQGGIRDATEEEGKYYIEKGEWPYCNYVSDYLDNNPSTIPSKYKVLDTIVTETNIRTLLSNRQVYNKLIAEKDAKLVPLPDAYSIFKGNMISPDESSTTLNNTNSTKLKKICKNINTA